MFKIGEFSKLVRVSPRMLRHYEKCGLFYPAAIDPFTGYRQYSSGQIPSLGNIVTLRDLGFSIDEIGEILPRFDDPIYMDKVLCTKAVSIKATIETQQSRLKKLMEMSDSIRKERNIMVYEVEVKALPAVKVLSLRDIIPHYRDEGMLWEKLGKFVVENGIECQGGGYSTYFDDEYKESDPDVEIAIQVDVLGADQGEFIYQEYAEIPLAATVRFSGPHDGGYDAASEKLAGWLEQNGYVFAGNLRGQVIVSPANDTNPENWLTELQLPVAKEVLT